MKNADKPINPIVNDSGFPTHESHLEKASLIGLTKREYFAAMAMQGVLASGRVTIDGHEWIAKQSIKNADELLKQLDQ